MSDLQLSRRRFLGVSSTAVAAGAAGLMGAGLTACGTSGPGSGGAKTDTVWTLQDSIENKIQQSAVDAFNKTSKSQMQLVVIPQTGYTDKVRVQMGTPNLPSLWFNWGGASTSPYIQAGQVVDLTSALTSDPAWQASFLPSVLKAGQIDGKYYGIPLRGMQPVVLYYNKTLFAQYNVQPPKTYADLLSLVDTFKSHGITPFALGASDQWPELMFLEYLTDRAGGPAPAANLVADPSGGWRDPAILEGLNRIQELVSRGAFGSKFSGVGYVNGAASQLFASGRAAMHLMGTWEYTNQLSQAPSFAKDSLAFTPFPTLDGGKGDAKAVVGNPTNYFSITNKAPDVDAGIAFLKQQMSGGTYVDALIASGDVPAVSGLETKLQSAPNSEFALWVYNAVQQAPSFALSWDQAVPSAQATALHTNLAKVFLGQQTPSQFVTTLVTTK